MEYKWQYSDIHTHTQEDKRLSMRKLRFRYEFKFWSWISDPWVAVPKRTEYSIRRFVNIAFPAFLRACLLACLLCVPSIPRVRVSECLSCRMEWSRVESSVACCRVLWIYCIGRRRSGIIFQPVQTIRSNKKSPNDDSDSDDDDDDDSYLLFCCVCWEFLRRILLGMLKVVWCVHSAMVFEFWSEKGGNIPTYEIWFLPRSSIAGWCCCSGSAFGSEFTCGGGRWRLISFLRSRSASAALYVYRGVFILSRPLLCPCCALEKARSERLGPFTKYP